MAQLGRFTHTAASTSTGLPASGASATVYREGATVNQVQNGTSPFTVTVRAIGKLKAADSVFINTTTSPTYSINSTTATTVVLSGFAGTLQLKDGDRIIASNSQPTLYSDDQGGASTNNPLSTSATGLASAYVEFGAYDYIVSGGGLSTTLFQAMVAPSEAPGQIRYADNFAANSSTGGIQEAINDLPSAGGIVWLSAKTYSINATLAITGNDITIEGAGDVSLLQMAHTPGVNFFGTSGTGITGSRFTARNFKIDGVNSTKTAGRGFNFGTCSDCLVENVTIKDTADAGIGTNAAGPSTTTRLRITNCRIDNPGDAGSSDGYGIILNNANDCIIQGNYIVNTLHSSIFSFSTSNNNIVIGNRMESGENGIRWGSVGSTANHWVVSNNEIDGCSVDGIRADGSYAIVTGNRSINNTLSGIKSDGPMVGSVWANNICKSNSNKGIYLNNDNGAVTDVLIEGNLCDSNTGDGIRVDPSVDTPAMTNIAVLNNVSVNNGTYGLLINIATTASTFNVHGNVYRNNTTQAENLYRSSNNVYGPMETQKKDDIASAATVNICGDGLYKVTGTADISTINAAPAGTIITLYFTGTAATNGVVDGSNLKLAGTFAYSPDGTMQLVCDGTNWYELGRSAN